MGCAWAAVFDWLRLADLPPFPLRTYKYPCRSHLHPDAQSRVYSLIHPQLHLRVHVHVHSRSGSTRLRTHANCQCPQPRTALLGPNFSLSLSNSYSILIQSLSYSYPILIQPLSNPYPTLVDPTAGIQPVCIRPWGLVRNLSLTCVLRQCAAIWQMPRVDRRC